MTAIVCVLLDTLGNTTTLVVLGIGVPSQKTCQCKDSSISIFLKKIRMKKIFVSPFQHNCVHCGEGYEKDQYFCHYHIIDLPLALLVGRPFNFNIIKEKMDKLVLSKCCEK